MNPKELFAKAVEQSWHCLHHIDHTHLGNDTPCSEWDLRALLNHMVYELLWVPEILAGKTIEEVGDRYERDLVRNDPHTAWQHAADSALIAVKRADEDSTVHLSYGDAPAGKYINEVACDIFIHGWDTGQAIRCTLLFDKKTAEKVYEYLKPQTKSYREAGLFAGELPVPEDADIQTKLLGLTGRKPLASV